MTTASTLPGPVTPSAPTLEPKMQNPKTLWQQGVWRWRYVGIRGTQKKSWGWEGLFHFLSGMMAVLVFKLKSALQSKNAFESAWSAFFFKVMYSPTCVAGLKFWM